MECNSLFSQYPFFPCMSTVYVAFYQLGMHACMDRGARKYRKHFQYLQEAFYKLYQVLPSSFIFLKPSFRLFLLTGVSHSSPARTN